MNSHKLTNLDIDTQYQKISFYLSQQDFLSALAYCIIQQDNTCRYDLLEKALTAYKKYLQGTFATPESVVCLSAQRVAEMTNGDVFEAIPDIFIYNQLKPDFVCLEALSRNVYFHILRQQITQPLD